MDRRIAIVGIGVRLPGGRGPDGLWRALHRRDTAIGTAPDSRAPYLADHDIPDPGFATVCRTGGFVDGWDEFDHPAFGVSAREAEVMDPQQRILLETAFEAIGDAGFTLEYLQRHVTAVVSGYITRDYWHSARHHTSLDAMSNVGNTGSGLSGRLAHVFGLTGPAITIDTACSSGLSAVAAAADNILLGNCSIALAAATNLILDPYETLSFYRSGMLAEDGLCKFGTTRADGFVRSDGFAVLALRPLQDALEDQDRIYAVLDAVATGNDGGRSGSLATPSVAGQVEVIRRAMTMAGREPADFSYVEAHGTGTTVGDRVELDALATVFADRTHPLPIGSVKTRIGHCEAASGMAGLVVAALSLHHASVPPMLVHGELHTDLSTAARGLLAHIEDNLALPNNAAIGVSSFGITGSNAHAVLSAPPTSPETASPSFPALPHLTSSGARPPADHAVDDDEPLAPALAYRVNHSVDQRQADGQTDPTASRPETSSTGSGLLAGLWREVPKVVFAFGGFGADWLDPTAVRDPILRNHLDAAYSAVRDHAAHQDRPVLDGRPDTPAALQPYATWASQLAIAFALRDYGVVPDAVLGHSFGDIAAACVAGALDLQESARLLVARTESVRMHSDNTRMIVITGAEVAHERDWIPASADVAVVNSPHCVVLACTADTLDTVAELAMDQGHEARALEVVFGSHSRFVEPALPAFEPATALGERAVDVPFYTSTGPAGGAPKTALPPQHWLDNLRAPVELPPVAQRLSEDGYGIIVDIGPRAVLAGHLRALVPGTVLATDALGGDNFLRTVLGALFAANCPLRPERLPPWTSELAATLSWQHSPRHVTSLPPAARTTSRPTAPEGEASESVTYRFTGPQVRALAGHRVRGETVAPGTLTLSCLARALQHADRPLTVDTVRFVEAIVIDDNAEQLALTVSRTDNRVEVHFTTDTSTGPTLCCTATVLPCAPTEPTPSITLPLNLAPLSVTDFYAGFAAAGNHWDGPFRAISELWASASHACVTARLDDASPLGGPIDPALFDAALHGLAAVHYQLVDGGEIHSPFYFEGADRITVHRSLLRGSSRSLIAPSTSGAGFDIAILDAHDRLAIRCEGVRIRPLRNRSRIPALRPVWRPLTTATAPAEQRTVDMFDSSLGRAVDAAAQTITPDTAPATRELIDTTCAAVLSTVEDGHELLVDARRPTLGKAKTLIDYLAGLGQVLTSLARTAAEYHTPLGIVVNDTERARVTEFDGAVSRFVFSLTGALPYELPTLMTAVVCAEAHQPLGELPSIRALAARGEYRIRRDHAGSLWAARLSHHINASIPRCSHPSGSHLDSWSLEVRPHSAKSCDVDIVWSDPRHGPRVVATRDLLETYRRAQRWPDALWAAQAAQQVESIARLVPEDDVVVVGTDRRATLLRAALDTRIPHATPGLAHDRRVSITVDGNDIHAGLAADNSPDRTALVVPGLAPTGDWPRSVTYRTTSTELEETLLGLPETSGEQREPDPTPTRHKRAAMIVGGNGGLGSSLAADLTARGFDQIILVGTRDIDSSETPFEYLRCDIGNPSAVELLHDRLEQVDAHKLFVFHLAGRLSTGPITDLDRSDWLRVLIPKVDGTRHLVEVARRAGAHMLVAYSSASSVLPSPQFAHYAAANAAMEGILAAAEGLRVRGVRWGFWAGAGMLHDLDPNRAFTPVGVGEIDADEGHTFLQEVLSATDTEFPVCYPADWEAVGQRYQRLQRDALLHELDLGNQQERTDSDSDSAAAGVVTTAGPAERATVVESLIMETLKISEVSTVRTASRLRGIGLDSLLAVELRTKIKSSFGRTVPIRTLLGPITSSQLHDLITDKSIPPR
ncbi:SDR family NAD(P)-dependent oxidoreductase [Nocardia callitridis]|uniref:Carrier domain-containing protein n=1 Tax=Nocardia callitridis TaxID=648753 RepID=A0ABP9K599_9NOCA